MSEEFEKALLGACLRSEENIPIVTDGLRTEEFSSFLRRSVFEGIKVLFEKKTPVDFLTLSNLLKNQGEEISLSQFMELQGSFFDGFDLDYYIDQVKIASRRRNLQHFLIEMLGMVQNQTIEYSELEAKVTQEVVGILHEDKDRKIKNSEDLLKPLIEVYYQRKIEREQGKIYFGVPTGFKPIDAILGGIQDGTFGILAGRMHHGKSTVAIDIFLNAIAAGFPSLYISLEQPSTEVLLHLIQKEIGIEPLRIKEGRLTPEEEKLLTHEIYHRFKKLPAWYDDQVRTLSEVLMRIRWRVLSYKIKFCIIDYLQLVENPLKGEPRHIQVAMISRQLKRLAMDLSIPILALSQLNKSPEERESKKIYLSDMRESEAISQDADFVIFIHRPILMGKDDKDHLELAKNRHGKTISRINVFYDEKKNTYKEMTSCGPKKNG